MVYNCGPKSLCLHTRVAVAAGLSNRRKSFDSIFLKDETNTIEISNNIHRPKSYTYVM